MLSRRVLGAIRSEENVRRPLQRLLPSRISSDYGRGYHAVRGRNVRRVQEHLRIKIMMGISRDPRQCQRTTYAAQHPQVPRTRSCIQRMVE